MAEQSDATLCTIPTYSTDDGGVVIEYGLVVATIALLLVVVGPTIVGAVSNFFAGMPAGLPAP